MITMESSDVTAKRASETDSLAVGEDKVDFSPMKKHKVDEEYDGNIESETESESDGSMDLGDYKGIQDASEPEPEWDVDSFDGREYESDPELRERIGDDNAYMEYREDRIKALENRGFLPDPFNFIDAMRDLDEPACRNMTNREYLADLASLCVKKLNEDKGKTVEFVSIVRGTTSGGARWKLYITFMAREYPNGPLVEYQAKAMVFAGAYRPPFPILCRPAPKPLI